MPIYKYTLHEDIQFKFLFGVHQLLNNTIYPSAYIKYVSNDKDVIFGAVKVLSDYETLSRNSNQAVLEVNIRKGYSWDGCTPKTKIKNKVIGIWDGFTDATTLLPDCYNASLVHDFLLQFRHQTLLPIDVINTVFYQQLNKDNFIFSKLYYNAVLLYFKLRNKLKLDD